MTASISRDPAQATRCLCASARPPNNARSRRAKASSGSPFSGRSQRAPLAPLSTPGGTFALVQEGDSITVEAKQRLLQLDVDEAELACRRSAWTKPDPRYRRGVLGKYAKLVSSSSLGAVTDLGL